MKGTNMKYIIRILLYLAGLFCLAIGVVLAIKSDLGVSPVSALPLSLSIITGMTLGTVTTMVFSFYVLMQIIILRRDFKLKSLLQVFFGGVFGIFVGFAEILFEWITPSNYIMQLVLIGLSIFVVAVGVVLVITMDIVPGAPEGLMLAICEKTGVPFDKMKVWFDSGSVVVAASLALIFIGNISFIREGTVISAICIGIVVGILSKLCKPWLEKMAFYPRAKDIEYSTSTN